MLLPVNLTGGIFTTGTFLSESVLSFINIINGRWSANYITNDECAVKDTSVDVLST